MKAAMQNDPLESLPPADLARLLDMERPEDWSPADIAAALRHQLDAPLLPDLLASPGSSAETLASLIKDCRRDDMTPQGWTCRTTFAQALTDDAAPLDLLRAIKEWARTARQIESSPLCPGPATVIYYAAIAAALCTAGTKITTLTDDQLREGMTWARSQDGAEKIAPLFARAVAQLHLP
jgi:hypothetical protein